MTNRPSKTALTPLKPYAKSVIFAPLFKGIECVTELLIPFIVRTIIDEGLNPSGSHYQDTSFVIYLGLVVFLMAIVGFGSTMLCQYVASKTSTAFALGLRKSIFSQMLSLSDAQLDNYGKSKALNLVNSDAFSLQTGVQMFMRLLVRAPFLVIGSIVASFIVHPIAGLIVLGALSLCALTIFIVLKVTPNHYAKLNRELDRLTALSEDGITGTRVVRAFGKDPYMQERFDETSLNYRKKAIFIAKFNSFINPLTFFFVNAAIVLILYLGSFAYDKTLLSVGSIVALVSFLTQSLTALLQFTRLVTSVSKAYASKVRIDSFLALESELTDGQIDALPEIGQGEKLYSLKGVHLSFGGESDVLSDINLEIYKGERIGIIGGTGSGKSTLLRLLERFVDPTEGSISYGGKPLQDYKLSLVRQPIAMVSQKSQIFKGTLLFNLTLGNPCSKEEVFRAMKEALVDEFIPTNEESLQKQVEEGGSNFSGGQKQRILLCRALLSSRPILVLDDAFSALDYRSDKAVRENIKKKENTLIIVSQRASSVLDCDRIIVLEQGKKVGEGKHEQLLEICPIYKEIYEAQVSQA